jgi:ornithine decarboxylase
VPGPAKILTDKAQESIYRIVEQISSGKETPLLIMNASAIRERYEQFREELKRLSNAKVFYAMKANPHPDIVKLLHELGAGFEVASKDELEIVSNLDIPSSKTISSNPVKIPLFIKSAYERGVNSFTFDSHTEIEKLSQLAAGSKVCVRLLVSNTGSEWPLERKFGVDIEHAVSLLIEARRKGLRPHGIAFHVGSQCSCPATWAEAIEKTKVVWESVKKQGVDLRAINIGGGFPCRYTEHVPSVREVIHTVKRALKAEFSFDRDIEIIAEPGRALVGEAGILATTVIGKAKRAGQDWLYLDVGVFNGLMEVMGGIKYRFIKANNGAAKNWVLAGPSCDSMDIIAERVELPEPEIGDRIYVMPAGAYTTAYASNFDGFHIPQVHII